jgi:hypothetical protein
MEQLTTSVYECTMPYQAHMICDLLSQAGISARVDGEFLAGAFGELTATPQYHQGSSRPGQGRGGPRVDF